ncbi:hypothetical protein [Paenibacillus hexagrammi]|uniref:SPOR domain-containing protein n=1 Tax=Paenibacillus hexagrammi TaxID=2908839 RepID=A0ABY3SF10_9BACL|nr:hypothetical protein [Paenibacillus sp. YPD9-1]UJF32008.1 hypothetical protein L0M14_19985 [Paenibacillus sp. YPD9-1]
MMNKGRITYRFNEQDRQEPTRRASKKEEKVIPLHQEEFEVVETQVEDTAEQITHLHRAEREQVESMFEPHALNTFTTDFGSWNSPIESESERVERIIRDSQAERSREEQPKAPIQGDSDDWASWSRKGPYIEPEVGTRYAKTTVTSWGRIATSVAGAVITGVAFGFFVLSMFSDSTDGQPGKIVQSAANTQTAVQDKAVGASAVPANANAAGDAAVPVSAGIAVTPVQLSAKSYAFLQNGVFSTKQSAVSAQDGLKKLGLASALDESDKLTVFVGFAPSRDDALALSQQLQDKQVEVYVKSMDIPAVSGIRWSGSKPDSVAPFLTEGDKLVQTISGLTVVHLPEAKLTSLSDTSLQAIRTSHQTMTGLAASMNEGLADPLKPYVQKMITAANSAVQSMEEYKKAPSTAMLWQAQTSMMQYIIAEKALLKEIAAS